MTTWLVVNLSKNKSQPGVEAGNCTVCGSLVKRGTAVSSSKQEVIKF